MAVHPPSGASGRRFDLDALLDAGLAVFFAEGFAAAQIADIARSAGTTKPTLYARLGNKDDIYVAVLKREAMVFEERVAEAYRRGGNLPLERLADVGMAPLFGFAAERPEGFHVLFRGDAVDGRVAAIRRGVIDHTIEMLAALIREREAAFGDEVDATVELVAAACVGVARQVCERAIECAEDIREAQQVAARFVAGAFRNLHPARRQPRGKV